MKPKEAIDTLKALSAAVEWDFPLDYAVAIDTAIEALEKQIPKEPYYVCNGLGFGGVGIWDLHCPNCDHNLDGDDEPDHCPNCGQGICWEDE